MRQNMYHYIAVLAICVLSSVTVDCAGTAYCPAGTVYNCQTGDSQLTNSTVCKLPAGSLKYPPTANSFEPFEKECIDGGFSGVQTFSTALSGVVNANAQLTVFKTAGKKLQITLWGTCPVALVPSSGHPAAPVVEVTVTGIRFDVGPNYYFPLNNNNTCYTAEIDLSHVCDPATSFYSYVTGGCVCLPNVKACPELDLAQDDVYLRVSASFYTWNTSCTPETNGERVNFPTGFPTTVPANNPKGWITVTPPQFQAQSLKSAKLIVTSDRTVYSQEDAHRLLQALKNNLTGLINITASFANVYQYTTTSSAVTATLFFDPAGNNPSELPPAIIGNVVSTANLRCVAVARQVFSFFSGIPITYSVSYSAQDLQPSYNLTCVNVTTSPVPPAPTCTPIPPSPQEEVYFAIGNASALVANDCSAVRMALQEALSAPGTGAVINPNFTSCSANVNVFGVSTLVVKYIALDGTADQVVKALANGGVTKLVEKLNICGDAAYVVISGGSGVSVGLNGKNPPDDVGLVYDSRLKCAVPAQLADRPSLSPAVFNKTTLKWTLFNPDPQIAQVNGGNFSNADCSSFSAVLEEEYGELLPANRTCTLTFGGDLFATFTFPSPPSGATETAILASRISSDVNSLTAVTNRMQLACGTTHIVQALGDSYDYLVANVPATGVIRYDCVDGTF